MSYKLSLFRLECAQNLEFGTVNELMIGFFKFFKAFLSIFFYLRGRKALFFCSETNKNSSYHNYYHHHYLKMKIPPLYG